MSERKAIDKRIAAGDGWAIHDAIVNSLNALSLIADRAGHVLAEDGEALARLRDLALAKPHYGTEPVISGCRKAGDVVTQETAATDRSGKERQRNAACAGRCPRATAGQRAGRKSC